jgi:hypothetical protein
MSNTERHQNLIAIRAKVKELHIKLETFSYCSDDFWAVYDELIKLLDHGIHVALREGDEQTTEEFKDMWDRLKERVPSGYWK